ncbi:MAG: DedA family protein [Thermacetogeniaceae bacterium]
MTPNHVYFLLFGLLLIEGMGTPGVPFEPVFIAAGYLIRQSQMSFFVAVLVGAVANLAGNALGYWLGASTMPVLFKRFSRFRPTEKGHALARHWFDRYGGVTVVVSRWFGVIRTPTIICAAAMGIRPAPYIFYSAIGAFTWTLAWQYGSWKGVNIVLRWWDWYLLHTTRLLNVMLAGLLLLIVVGGIYLCLKRYYPYRGGQHD